jgi:hypothetical protein
MCVVGLGVDSAGQRAPPHVLWSWPIGATTQPGHLGSIPTGAAALPTILRVAWAQTYPGGQSRWSYHSRLAVPVSCVANNRARSAGGARRAVCGIVAVNEH